MVPFQLDYSRDIMTRYHVTSFNSHTGVSAARVQHMLKYIFTFFILGGLLVNIEILLEPKSSLTDF